MVMDFGFIKNLMLEHIHDPCDHGLILSLQDPYRNQITDAMRHYGDGTTPWLKLYLIHGPPTAEVLAQHWFEQLVPNVVKHTRGRGHLEAVRVWETPNSLAVYPA